jgi:hypothetical protein
MVKNIYSLLNTTDMKKILLITIIILPVLAMAQQPKMHTRVYGGVNTTSFVYQIEGVEKDIFTGWQVGGGFRIMHRRGFLGIDAVYKNYGITIAPGEDVDLDFDEPITITMNGLEFPLTMGYVAVKKPLFKWFLYGGLVSRFSLRGKYEYEGETGTFKPSELNLNVYNLGAKFGTQFDLAFFNFDFGYTISITNAVSGKARTNSHGLELSAGILF